MLRVDGEEHGESSAKKITRVVSAEVPPQAFRKRAHFDWSVAERSNVVSDAGWALGFQLDDFEKFQGTSSSMRLFGWPAAMTSDAALSEA